MIWTSENNWYKWDYSKDPTIIRQSSDLEFRTVYTKSDKPINTFKEELLANARSTLDHYPNLRPCVFFSGGMDSELIVRSYLEIGANPEVYIVRYEKDYNLYDVSYAVTICTSLKIDYKIIDFQLERFYETDAEIISEQAQIDRPRMLPHLKFSEYVDGLTIVGHSDVRWFRANDDYQDKGIWLAQDFEHDIGCDKYNIMHDIPAVYQWWKWSPGIVLSYTTMKWFRNLVNDQYPGRLGINSTKIDGFREIYPSMLYREKQTGFEKISHIIDEFEKHLEKKYSGLPYRNDQKRTLDQLWKEITGQKYPQ